MTNHDYINEHYPQATEAQKEAIAERIAIMVVDGMVEEEKARQWAIFGKFEDCSGSAYTQHGTFHGRIFDSHISGSAYTQLAH